MTTSSPVTLTRLKIHNVRNLRAARLENLEKINVFHGLNGSGKTSVLEAIHILGMSRSFRGASIKSTITHGEDACTVFGEACVPQSRLVQSIGVHRERSGVSRIKIAGEPAKSIAELVALLPLQVINSTSFDLLTGSPNTRRQFINWGVFHVEHRFYGEWQRFQRCIKQRNMVLRRGKILTNELEIWSRELAISGGKIDVYRQDYIEKLIPAFQTIMESLAPELVNNLLLRYRRGWDKGFNYEQALAKSLTTDLEQGYTHVGPQRADIKVSIDGHSAADTLSRGQQKLVVCGLKLAQGLIMAGASKAVCTYLVDDLPSELDQEHCARVCSLLASLDAQVFISAVEKTDISAAWPQGHDLAMFHVEQGQVAPGR